MRTTVLLPLALVLAIGLVIAAKWRASSEPLQSAAASLPAAPAESSMPSGSAAATSPLAAFRSAIANASAGEWSLLNGTVLAPSDLGMWDDFRVGSPVVMRTGPSKLRMWFIGCRLADAHHDCGIGHAESADGVSWVRAEAPVFVPPDLPMLHWLGSLAVVKTANGYSMWYSVDGDRYADRPLGTLHLATSADGLVWENVGRVHSAAGRRTIRHAVYHDSRTFHLWYADVSSGEGESLAHFTSIDGKTWTAAGSDALDGDAGSVGRPWVIGDGRGGFRALIVDSGGTPAVRWIASADGTAWQAASTEFRPNESGNGVPVIDAFGSQEAGGLWLWTTTAPPGSVAESIGVAFKKGSGS